MRNFQKWDRFELNKKGKNQGWNDKKPELGGKIDWKNACACLHEVVIWYYFSFSCKINSSYCNDF